MNLKIYLLSGLLFTASASAYAQEEAKVVTLANDAGAVTWSQFVNAINNPSSIQGSAPEGLKTAMDNAEKAYNEAVAAAATAETNEKNAKDEYDTANYNLGQWQSQLSALNASEKKPLSWLQSAYDNAVAFQKAFQAVLDDETYNKNETFVWYKIVKSGRTNVLSLCFFDQDTNPGNDFINIGETAFYEALDGKSISSLRIYLGVGYTDNAEHLLSVNTFGGNFHTAINNAVGALETLINNGKYDINAAKKAELSENIAKYTTVGEDGKTKMKLLLEASQAASVAKTEADKAVETKLKEYEAAQKKYNDAVADSKDAALINYKTVNLTADVTANETIKDFDGIIYGNGHVITYSGEGALFNKFGGILSNLAVNGNVFNASTSAAGYNNVAYWNGTTGAFRDVDNNRTEYETLETLGFAVRNFFGVDFAKGLAPLGDESKMYCITIYEPDAANNSVKYVQLKDSKFVTGADLKEVTIPTNRFAKSATLDLEKAGFNNLFFDKNGENVCKTVAITDRESFYCPVDLKVEKIEYLRDFTAGMNAVCLPFELEVPDENDANITALCRFDRESPEKFYFKKVAESIPANTPTLLVAKKGFSFEDLNLTDVVIKHTPDNQMLMDEGNEEDPSKSYGLLRKATREEFEGGAQAPYKVYGLKKDGKFAPAAANVNLLAFRMVLYSEIAQENGPSAAPRRIGILDEKGVEITDAITTGIDDVYNDGTELDITAGAGEIVISSAKDLGEVTVYSVDGKVAAVADVAAGTTTVNVQNGLYIVLGKKVMVK